MAFFNLFSNKRNGNDSTINADELSGETQGHSDTTEIKPNLSIHPSLKQSELYYVYKFQNNQLPPLKPNQISISGIQLDKKDDTYDVHAFIRHSIDKTINLGETTLLLMNEEGKALGRKTFNLSSLGSLPPLTSRPWVFTFNKNDILTDSIPTTGWKLAFELRPKHHLDLAESWQQSLAKDQIDKLDALVNRMVPPKPGELNLMGLNVGFNNNGDLTVSLLIRNGSPNNISIESLPLNVEDASGESVASGQFKLDNFEVKANTSKPWTFIFPSNLIKINDPDFSSWKVVVPNN